MTALATKTVEATRDPVALNRLSQVVDLADAPVRVRRRSSAAAFNWQTYERRTFGFMTSAA